MSAAEQKFEDAVKVAHSRLMELGYSKHQLQNPYVPAGGSKGLFLGGYSRTLGKHPLSLSENGLPTDKTVFRAYHVLVKGVHNAVAEQMGVDMSNFESDIEDFAWLDFSLAAVDGKLGKGKDAPQIRLAKDTIYYKAIKAVGMATIDVMKARNGGEQVAILSMCPEWNQWLEMLSRDVRVTSVGSTRHFMQFGNMLSQKASQTAKQRKEERARWDSDVAVFYGHALGYPEGELGRIWHPWEELVESGLVLDPDERAEFSFGGGSGADPSAAGMLTLNPIFFATCRCGCRRHQQIDR